MLYEGEVIEDVCNRLRSEGFEIKQALDTSQGGDDIIAVRKRGIVRQVYIEAKGETSSSNKTRRFGQPFSRSQVLDHIAKAFFKAATILAKNSENSAVGAGIALPDNKNHREVFSCIEPIVEKLGIMVFWVSNDHNVTVKGLWK